MDETEKTVGTPGVDEGAETSARDVAPEDSEATAEHVEEELRAVKDELETMHDRHLRLAAEFDNYRKRNERERREAGLRARADLVRELLEVLDDLERVSDQAPDGADGEAILEGVELVERKFRRVLESAGLRAVEAVDATFDPATMEALMMVPAESPEDDDVVADVIQQGYLLGDILVRPARVRVKKYEGQDD